MLKNVRDNNNNKNNQPNKLNNNINGSIIDYRYNHNKITNSTNSITN